MKASEFESFQEVMKSVVELYSKPELSEFALTIWWKSLQNYTLAEVQAGLSRHVQNPDNGQFMPKPADIIRSLQGSSNDNSALAWSLVDRSVRSIGPYPDVVFDDPRIHLVIQDMGGWNRLCTEHTDDDWPFVQREFEQRYRGYCSRPIPAEYPKKLAGISNSQNNQRGYQQEKPMLIGNHDKALLVLQGGSDKPAKLFKRLDDSNVITLPQLGSDAGDAA